MPSFEHSIDIAASPDRTWAVLGDLASVARWAPGVTSVEVDGMTRVCTFADGHVQHERIDDYSPATRSYAYAIEGGLPVRDNCGTFRVEEKGRRSRVVWVSSFEPLDPGSEDQLVATWSDAVPMILAQLKSTVEA